MNTRKIKKWFRNIVPNWEKRRLNKLLDGFERAGIINTQYGKTTIQE